MDQSSTKYFSLIKLIVEVPFNFTFFSFFKLFLPFINALLLPFRINSPFGLGSILVVSFIFYIFKIVYLHQQVVCETRRTVSLLLSTLPNIKCFTMLIISNFLIPQDRMKILYTLLFLPTTHPRSKGNVYMIRVVVVLLGVVRFDIITVDIINFGGGWTMICTFGLFVFAFEDEVAVIINGGVDKKGSNFFFCFFDSFISKLSSLQHVLFFYFIYS